MSVTKQGIRDLNSIGNKKRLNGRSDKGQDQCFHIWEELIGEDYLVFKKCRRCNFEDVLKF